MISVFRRAYNRRLYFNQRLLTSSKKDGEFKFDTSLGFDQKSSYFLLKDLTINKVSGCDYLLKKHEPIRKAVSSVIGEKGFYTLVTLAFYERFIPGCTIDELHPLVSKFQEKGIGAIIAYANESDLDTFKGENTILFGIEPHDKQLIKNDVTENLIDYDHFGENLIFKIHPAYKKVYENFKSLLLMKEKFNNVDYIALKCTALSDPRSLKSASEYIEKIRNIFDKNSENHTMNIKQFSLSLNDIGINHDETEQVKKLFNFSGKNSTKIVWNDYIQLFHPTKPLKMIFGTKLFEKNIFLDIYDSTAMLYMWMMTKSLSDIAKTSKMRILIDAEQTYYQPLITFYATDFMRKYNKNGDSIIYNTYQCYLKNAIDIIKKDYVECQKEKNPYKFNVKLVRGAYMVQERELAKEAGHQSPIQDTKEETDNSYNSSMEFLLSKVSEGNSDIIVASHNTTSILKATELMDKFSINPSSSSVNFGQLYGFSDYITYSLAKYNYKPYKYLPYESIDILWPYLIRRLQENGSVLGLSRFDSEYIKDELKRRIGRKRKTIKNTNA